MIAPDFAATAGAADVVAYDELSSNCSLTDFIFVVLAETSVIKK